MLMSVIAVLFASKTRKTHHHPKSDRLSKCIHGRKHKLATNVSFDVDTQLNSDSVSKKSAREECGTQTWGLFSWTTRRDPIAC
jgi:hypothetical protein